MNFYVAYKLCYRLNHVANSDVDNDNNKQYCYYMLATHSKFQIIRGWWQKSEHGQLKNKTPFKAQRGKHIPLQFSTQSEKRIVHNYDDKYLH